MERIADIWTQKNSIRHGSVSTHIVQHNDQPISENIKTCIHADGTAIVVASEIIAKVKTTLMEAFKVMPTSYKSEMPAEKWTLIGVTKLSNIVLLPNTSELPWTKGSYSKATNDQQQHSQQTCETEMGSITCHFKYIDACILCRNCRICRYR